VEAVSTRSLGRTELCRCWRDRVGHEGSYQATQPSSKTLGLGSSAETTSVSSTIFCISPLRNGALALPVGAYRVVNVIRPPCGERVVRARRRLQLVMPLRDGGLSGRSGLGKEPEGAKIFVRF
jgi:hypothetical protein